MKQTLLNTFLVAAGLFAGTMGAWAEETTTATVKMTYVDYNNQTTSYGEITEGNTAKTGYNKISNGTVGFGTTSWNVNYITYIQVDASAIDGTITGATLTADCSGAGTDKDRAAKYGVGYNSSTWSADMTYKTAERSITTVGTEVSTSSKRQTTFNSLSFDITDALKDDEDKIVTLLVYETAAGGGLIKNPQVTVTYISSSAKTADYTVKYVLQGTTTELRTATTGTTEVGGTYKVTDEDKASFFVDGKKYIYVSDDAASQSINENGSTVITITYREAATWSYTVNAVDDSGNILKDGFAKGTNFEGETFNVAYPYAFNIDGTLYTSGKQNSGYYFSITLSEETNIKTVTYTASDITDVVYFSEAEDIDGLTKANNSNTFIRSSNGASAYAATENVAFTKLPAGTYKLTTVICDTKTNKATWDFLAGEKNIFTFTASAVNWSSGTSDQFTLAEETPIYLGKGGNANQAVDFIYIQRVATDAALSITSAGYATFSPASNVTIPEGVTVYTVAVNEDNSTITMTQIASEAVLPAGTGVLVAGEAGGYTFKGTTADATELTNNDLKVAGESTVADGKQYGLAQVDGKVGFYKITSGETLKAGKAYLEVSEESAAKMSFFSLDGGLTGIGSVEAAKAANSAFYTLQGVKVAKPTKGLYISNGKKVIVK